MSSFKLSVGDFLDKLDSVASSQVKISMLEDVLKKLDQEKKEDEKMNQDPSAERESAIALLSSVHRDIIQTMSNLQPPPRDLFTAPSSSSLHPHARNFFTPPPSSSLDPRTTSFLPPQSTDFFTEPSSSSEPPPTHFFITPPSSMPSSLSTRPFLPLPSEASSSSSPALVTDLSLRIGPPLSESFLGLDPPRPSQPLLLHNSPLPLPQLPTTFRPSVPSLSSLPGLCFQGPPSLLLPNKPAFHWTEKLKRSFDVAVMVLGGLNRATPTGIRDLMEEDVTVEQIGSHLQRARRAHVLNNQAEAVVDHQVDALADHQDEAVDQVDALADHQDEAVDHQVDALADPGKRAREAEDQDKAEPSSKRNKVG